MFRVQSLKDNEILSSHIIGASGEQPQTQTGNYLSREMPNSDETVHSNPSEPAVFLKAAGKMGSLGQQFCIFDGQTSTRNGAFEVDQPSSKEGPVEVVLLLQPDFLATKWWSAAGRGATSKGNISGGVSRSGSVRVLKCAANAYAHPTSLRVWVEHFPARVVLYEGQNNAALSRTFSVRTCRSRDLAVFAGSPFAADRGPFLAFHQAVRLAHAAASSLSALWASLLDFQSLKWYPLF